MAELHRGAGVVRDIPDTGVYGILLELGQARETGLLEVYGQGRVSRLALRRGVPLHASPGAIRWRLGDVIDHLGLPVAGGRAALDHAVVPRSRRAGEELIARGLASTPIVELALKEQVRLRAQDFLPRRSGRCRFFSGPRFLAGVPRLPDRWTAPDLVAAVRRATERHEALRWLLRRLESSDDPRAALGVPAGATVEQARAAFRQLAKAHHPDHLAGVTDGVALDLHRRAFAAALLAVQRLEAGTPPP
jgi:hypothetical protein